MTFAQSSSEKKIKYSKKDFYSCQIEQNIYSFWWYKNNFQWFPEGDTLPYLVDDRNYKGIINYGVEFISRERRNLNFNENYELFKLHFKMDKFEFHPLDSIVEIEGTITGGWTNWKLFGVNNNVEIFIGSINETIKPSYFQYFYNSKEYKIVYEGNEIKENVVLDSFPAYFVDNYKHYKTERGTERHFSIRAKVDENSHLIFGLSSCFAEIFDIGKLIYTPEKLKPNNIDETTIDSRESLVIINNNVQVSANKDLSKNQTSKYYAITNKAEDYILVNQYANAKKEYNRLLADNQYIFARDLHNAIRTAVLSRDYENALIWSKMLVLKGVTLNYFNIKIFDRFKKTPFWKELLTNFSDLNIEYTQGLNTNLIKELNNIIQIDQDAYHKNSQGQIEREKLAEVTENVDQKFINLIEQEGFPSEEKIGVTLIGDTLIAAVPSYYSIIFHSFQTKSRNLEKISKIRKTYSNNFEYDAERDRLSSFTKSAGTCLQIYKGNLYNLKSCNLNQKQISKIAFRFENKNGFIIEDGEFIIIAYERENEINEDKYIKEDFDFVMKLTDDWFFYEK